MRKSWEKPELTILYRGKPEESVAQSTNCKHQPQHAISANDDNGSCNGPTITDHCGTCWNNANQS